MAEVLAGPLGNPSGSHPPAQRAKRLLEEARDEVAAFVHRAPGEVVFTSGGTESADLAVLGTVEAALAEHGDPVVLASAVEHPAVRESCRAAGRLGADARELPVDRAGVVDLDALARSLFSRVVLVAIMTANNETGVVQPVGTVVDAVRRRTPNAVVFTDAVQAAPHLDIAEWCADADLISLSAHKVGGPVGVGALVVGPAVALSPRQHGGGQERERRSGTQDVVGAVGLATALRAAASERVATSARVSRAAGPPRGRPARGDTLGATDGPARCPRAPGPPPSVPARDRARGAARRPRRGGGVRVGWFVLCQRRARAEPRAGCHGGTPAPGRRRGPLHARLDHDRRRRRPRARRGARRRDVVARLLLKTGGTLVKMRVLVAMSGGVDSSVAAALLVEQGHDVVGATLKLWGGASDSGCCSVADVEDARRVAQQLGIEHHVFNLTEDFERHVVTPYVEEHARGRTPNPCIECNRSMKFDRLLHRARRLGFDRLATGHHARVTVEGSGGWRPRSSGRRESHEGRCAAAASGRRFGEGPVVRLVDAGPGGIGPHGAPGRRHDEGRGAGARPPARTSHRGQA